MGAGDVDGDGDADILWQHAFGQVHYWPIQNGQRLFRFSKKLLHFLPSLTEILTPVVVP